MSDDRDPDSPATFQDVRVLYQMMAGIMSGQMLNPMIPDEQKVLSVKFLASSATHFEGREAAEEFLDAFTGGGYSLNKELEEQGIEKEARLDIVMKTVLGKKEEN